MKGKKLLWKPEYKYQLWDISNYAFIWIKVLDDCLVKKKVVPDDDVRSIIGTSFSFHEVEDIDQRKLIYKLYETDKK